MFHVSIRNVYLAPRVSEAGPRKKKKKKKKIAQQASDRSAEMFLIYRENRSHG